MKRDDIYTVTFPVTEALLPADIHEKLSEIHRQLRRTASSSKPKGEITIAAFVTQPSEPEPPNEPGGLERNLLEICRLAHKHEVQHWLDAPGTDTEKLAAILPLARECLAVLRDATENRSGGPRRA